MTFNYDPNHKNCFWSKGPNQPMHTIRLTLGVWQASEGVKQ